MKFYIKHETRGRLRIHLAQKRMSYEQADTLLYYLENLDGVASAKVYERTCDAVVNYQGDRDAVIAASENFIIRMWKCLYRCYAELGRALNAEYQEKLISKVIYHYGRRLFLPYPLNAIYTTATSLKYIWKGIDTLLHRKIRCRFWMQLQSVYPYCVRTLVLQVPLCSCLESVRSWKSGHIRNLVTLQGPCH